jgi:hypothetical protein
MPKHKREPRPTMLPATSAEADAAKVITDKIEHWWDKFGEMASSEAARRVIENDLYQHLLAGTFDIDTAIALANAEFAAADGALRAYARAYGSAGRWSELPVEVQGWALAALERPPLTTYRRGIVDILTRDAAIRVMVEEAARVWSLARTRNNSTEKPSAAYYVALVVKLKEGTVNDIIWGRGKQADRLAGYVISFLKKN